MENRYDSASVKVLGLIYENRYTVLSSINPETNFPKTPPQEKSKLIELLIQMDNKLNSLESRDLKQKKINLKT